MRSIHTIERLLGSVVVAVAMAACGGSGGVDDPPIAAAPPNVTASGGSVVSDDGRATLTVPAAAASAPATVTLTADTGPAPPASAMIVEGTRYLIGGDGGDLAAAAELRFTAGSAFPAALLPRRDGLAQAFAYGAPTTAPCDLNGDGVIDGADASLWSLGYQCFQMPRLVTVPALTSLGACVTPQGANITCAISSLSIRAVGLQFDPIAPTVGVVSFDGPMKPQAITTPGTYTLEVTATDNFGVARVDFYAVSTHRGNITRTKVATAASPPYRGSIALSIADNGKVDSFIAEAVDTWGNVSGRGVALVVAIQAPDTTPPLVIASASSLVVQVGGSLTLTANASDDVGVVKIEFLKNGVVVSESATVPAALQILSVGAEDIGTVVWTIRAYDAAGNVGSKTLNVTVQPAAGEAWVHASIGDDNNAGTAAAPFKTLGKAFATVGMNGTVWLLGSTVITPTSEGLSGSQIFTGINVPTGVQIKAVTPDAPTIGITLAFASGGHVVDVRFDPSTIGRVLASGGVVTLNRVRWAKLGATDLAHGIVVSGSAQVTVGSIGQTNFDYVLSGLGSFATVADTAEITVLGGRIDGAGQQGGFELDGTAKLRLDGVKIIRSLGSWMSGLGAIYVGGTANRVELSGTLMDLGGGITTACIVQDRQVAGAVTDASIVLQNSTLANCGGGGIQLREGISSLGLFNSTISGSGRYAIQSGQIGFDSGNQFGRPEIGLINSQLTGNFLGSVHMNKGGVLTMNGSSLSGGARAITMEGADQRYSLLARQSSIAADIDAIWLQGDAGSLYTLGTSNSAPGNNVFAAGTTVLRVSVSAGVLVRAVGNTWKANAQGADAAGLYSTALCGGTSPCEVTTGSGANYTFSDAGAGAVLRLAE